MPPRKKQKTTEDSSVPVGGVEEVGGAHDGAASGSSAAAEEAVSEKLDKLPPNAYITMPVPEGEFLGPVDEAAEEEGADDDEDEEEEEEEEEEEDDDDDDDDDWEQPGTRKYRKVYKKDLKNGRLLKPASEFKDRKWIIQKQAWEMYCDFCQRADYCNPAAFGMNVFNDFEAYGIMELLENMLVLFDLMRKKKDEEEALWGTWAVLSAMAVWLDSGLASSLIMVEDGERAKQLATLVGTAVLTGLTMVERAGELKPDSKFLDLGIVISTYLRWTLDATEVCMEDEAFAWYQDVVGYFERSGIDAGKGVKGTREHLVKLTGENPSAPGTKKDAWGWEARLKKYKKDHVAGRMGGRGFDITKWSRRDRAQYSFSGKDPLAKFSDKDLKGDMIALNRD